jgi:hypothetical protein
MGRFEALSAELAVVRLEDRLVALKAQDAADPGELMAVKLELRDARRVHREARSGVPPAPGDAVAAPETVHAAAKVSD